MVFDIRCLRTTLNLATKRNQCQAVDTAPEPLNTTGICHVTSCKCTIRIYRPTKDKRFLYRENGREYEVWGRTATHAAKQLLEFGFQTVDLKRLTEIGDGSPQDIKPIL